jgi:hypothetical protein
MAKLKLDDARLRGGRRGVSMRPEAGSLVVQEARDEAVFFGPAPGRRKVTAA